MLENQARSGETWAFLVSEPSRMSDAVAIDTGLCSPKYRRYVRLLLGYLQSCCCRDTAVVLNGYALINVFAPFSHWWRVFSEEHLARSVLRGAGSTAESGLPEEVAHFSPLQRTGCRPTVNTKVLRVAVV